MRRQIGIIFLLFLFFLSGCSLNTDIGEGDVSYKQSSLDYSEPLDINSPEGLAQYTGNAYMDMIAGKTDPKEEFPVLLSHSSEGSQKLMEGAMDRFVQDIRLSKQYFESNDKAIEGYVYSETIYDGDDNASVYRIQKMNDGKLYYFKQDFVLEDGTWKIRGDNVQDPFVLTGRS
ncbi:MAG TPA: hypothetical protein VN366_01525 [Feifaniaceae bacterium]|nr:hypothetical protein [Feifaniaceae bacterium]